MLFAQLPTSTATEIGTWLVCAAAIMVIVNQAKTLFIRKPPLSSEFANKDDLERQVGSHAGRLERVERDFMTRIEFSEFRTEIRNSHSVLSAKLDTHTTTMLEKLESLKAELAAGNERRASSSHRESDEIVAMIARLDERTRKQS